jgi:hypothetical protein
MGGFLYFNRFVVVYCFRPASREGRRCHENFSMDIIRRRGADGMRQQLR